MTLELNLFFWVVTVQSVTQLCLLSQYARKDLLLDDEILERSFL